MASFSDFFRALMPEKPRQVNREFGRRLNPRYYERPATGILDADYIHFVVTQAKEGQMTKLLALYREIEVADDVIGSSMATRRLAVLSDVPRVQPCRKGVAADQRAADLFAAALDNSPSFLPGITHLLSGCVWPVAVCGIRWVPGRLDYSRFELRQVPLEQLDYLTGDLRIAGVDDAGTVLSGQSHFPDPGRYVVHRGHLATHPDQWGGPFRSLLFWHLFGACDRDWWARFLERFGAPFLVGKYDPDDEESRQNLESAFREAARMFGIVATTDTNIELHEAKSSVGADAFAKFLDIATAAKTRVILGQTLSAKADSTGLGSGVAGLQGQVRSEYRAWDRLCLASTIRRFIVMPFMEVNRLDGEPPKLVWPGDPADLGSIGQFLQSVGAAGLEPDDTGVDAINDLTGIPLRRAGGAMNLGAERPFVREAEAAPAAILAAVAPRPQMVPDQLLRRGTAELLRALGRDHAGVGEILASSQTGAELVARLEEHFSRGKALSSASALSDLAAAAGANAG